MEAFSLGEAQTRACCLMGTPTMPARSQAAASTVVGGASNPHMTQFTGERSEVEDSPSLTLKVSVALSPHGQVRYREYVYVADTKNACYANLCSPKYTR